MAGLSGTKQQKLQAPSAVVMVRPHHFFPNEQTAADNSFQVAEDGDSVLTARAAYEEVTGAAEALSAVGVTVHLFDDLCDNRPDAVFPNNWFSTHPDGRIALYPMCAPSRRLERRSDIIDSLKSLYHVTGLVDYSHHEKDGRFLESTGAMVLDHIHHVAYVSLSQRADAGLVAGFCSDFGFTALAFDTAGPDGKPIYHTNVMMTLGTRIALVCPAAIKTKADRAALVARLEATGRRVIDLTFDQMSHFAGNALELHGRDGPILVMSETGVKTLAAPQRAAIETVLPLLPLHVPTIEMAGGSARCMLAGIHLPEK